MTYRFRIFKNIRKMDSSYITECGYKGSASQPANQSVSLSVLERQTDLYNNYIYIYIYIYHISFLNDFYRFRRCKNNEEVESTYIMEYEYYGPASQPVSQPASQAVSMSVLD